MVNEENKVVSWFARIGIVGFLFFTLKGLLWFLIPALILWWDGIIH
jgi:hypothetical protein